MIAFDGTFTEDDRAATFRGLGREIFFIQIGAMDGVLLDPIHSFVKELSWRGIFLEPVPDMFEKLKANYAGYDNLVFVNAAIADFDGQIKMTRINPAVVEEGKLPDAALGLTTLMPDRGIIGGRRPSAELEQIWATYQQTFDVRCCTLKTILKTHNITTVDALIIDTEGADWMVARQLPLDQFKPRVVYLEYNHLSGYEQTACAYHFRNHGYKIYLEQLNQENFLAVYAGS